MLSVRAPAQHNVRARKPDRSPTRTHTFFLHARTHVRTYVRTPALTETNHRPTPTDRTLPYTPVRYLLFTLHYLFGYILFVRLGLVSRRIMHAVLGVHKKVLFTRSDSSLKSQFSQLVEPSSCLLLYLLIKQWFFVVVFAYRLSPISTFSGILPI
jgi:hypothetical protein